MQNGTHINSNHYTTQNKKGTTNGHNLIAIQTLKSCKLTITNIWIQNNI